MTVYRYTPKYPVVHPLPPFELIIKSVRFSDLLVIAGFGVAAFTVNWFGARKSLRYYNSRFMGTIGLIAGLAYVDLSVTQRLMGYYPNEPEVKRFGFYTKEELEAWHRDDIPNGELIGRIPKEREIK